jgi:hypothetical protein
MRRRELMLLVGGAMTAARALYAQQRAMPVIGFLGLASPGPFAPFVTAFHQGLRETGYIDGQNVAIEYRWAEGQQDRQGGGDHSNPSHLAGEYNDSLEEVPKHRPSPFSATAAERRTGTR